MTAAHILAGASPTSLDDAAAGLAGKAGQSFGGDRRPTWQALTVAGPSGQTASGALMMASRPGCSAPMVTHRSGTSRSHGRCSDLTDADRHGSYRNFADGIR